jgi:hypothetical protein
LEVDTPLSNISPNFLGLYPLFRLDQPLNEQGRVFNEGDRVIFIENDGFKAVLKEAKVNIPLVEDVFVESNWDVVEQLKLSEKYELYTYDGLIEDYDFVNLDRYKTAWGEIDKGWSSCVFKWRQAKTPKQFLYEKGDIFLKLSPCGETLCVYVVIQNMEVGDEVRDRCVRHFCVGTGEDKCSGYRRRKTPESLYQVVEIGSRSDFIEPPLRV